MTDSVTYVGDNIEKCLTVDPKSGQHQVTIATGSYVIEAPLIASAIHASAATTALSALSPQAPMQCLPPKRAATYSLQPDTRLVVAP